jgi:hypothetical protein
MIGGVAYPVRPALGVKIIFTTAGSAWVRSRIAPA